MPCVNRQVYGSSLCLTNQFEKPRKYRKGGIIVLRLFCFLLKHRLHHIFNLLIPGRSSPTDEVSLMSSLEMQEARSIFHVGKPRTSNAEKRTLIDKA